MKNVLALLLPVLGAGTLACQDAKKNPVVVMETSLGTIEIELDQEKAPITVKNFLSYVEKKHYDGTIFHRVKKNFMIQGGGFDKDMQQKKTDAPIKNEAKNGLKNLRGTIAMARTPEIDSATSQFFISDKDNNFLDHKPNGGNEGYGYAVFGKVTSGLEVVDKIAGVRTGDRGGHENVPVETVEIKSVKLKDRK